ncbi:DUF1330 domain-containing protein [Tabrizicola piscis]|uniref:DUF1330 domain-containing protein n=1 Tax=Tabrizicola piscis TaxID=2494374 RepID=A0A3S8U9I0_9RHOB|nr:DUF1330 domain-containing protein [Tabrizicola piscis]AZL60274.1 DUF1330 domain-containing protein [Tabrizicola piscis]
MAVTVLALTTLHPGGDAALQTYLDVVGPLMESAGARLVSRHAVARVLAGDGPARYVSLVSYPSEAAVREVFESPAYLALSSVKAAAFSHYEVSLLDRMV